ncbi:MAG: alpha/beta fold hydrolase [Phycisphaerales bacterium]|nr:alpha/beta fold hydrolase [Phycisphaerales bacterium]
MSDTFRAVVLGALALVAAAMLFSLVSGCFSERSFAMRRADLRFVPAATETSADATTLPAAQRRGAREWLRGAHAELVRLLPRHSHRALLTEDLCDGDGRPADVFGHFRMNPATLHTLAGNCRGIAFTAQAAGAKSYIEMPAPEWSGFEDVWIPVGGGLELCGRLGVARDVSGAPLVTDCIVILPGLLGDNGVLRTRDIAAGLRANGFHALALEQRGHGQTERRFGHVAYTWGALETGELLAVSEWLTAQPMIRRTGLIGFCWGANHALLTAWEDGRGADDRGVPKRLAALQRRAGAGPHFAAGVVACSPVLRFEKLIEATRSNWSVLKHPVYDALQDTLESRAIRKGYPEATRSLRRLLEMDAAIDPALYEGIVDDGIHYVRLMSHNGTEVIPKLEAARVPVLILHAANDPLAPAQEIADFMAPLRNPNVAAVILPDGGHVGFAPYARGYFYSLITNFFSAERGPAAIPAAARSAAAGGE